MKHTQIVFAALSILASTAAHAANCVDFSGNWQGTCSQNGLVTSDQVGIRQTGCEQIAFGNLVSVIGTTKTYSQTQGDVLTTVTISTAWNEDRTQLPGRLKIEKSLVSQPNRRQSTEVQTGMGMNGSKLVLVTKDSQGSITQCVYDRR